MNTSISAIRGIAITQPVIGRVMMGHIDIHADGRCIPQTDDYFTVTTLVQYDDRSWEVHPITESLKQSQQTQPRRRDAAAKRSVQQKLQSIPIRIAYNMPVLSLHSSYSSYDPRTGRILCTGNGETAKRSTPDGIATMACPRPEACEFGQHHRCKNMSRFYMHIEGQDDELGTFVLRSTSWNSLRSISARLAMLHGLTGGRLAGLPLMLQLKSKSTMMSGRQPVFFADLVFRPGMTMAQAIAIAKDFQKERAQSGLSQEGLEQALVAGLNNSDFADQAEDIDAWIAEVDVVGRAGTDAKRTSLHGLDSVRLAATNTHPPGAVPGQASGLAVNAEMNE